MKLLVQKYLENKSLKSLQEDHGVYASFSVCGSFFSLNYDQIESKENDVLAQECRGLILSLDDGKSLLPNSQIINNKYSYDHIIPGVTKILAFPFKRFFNLGQQSSANIDWNSAKVQEKMDGTLAIVWYNPFLNKWNMGTRACPEAHLLMNNGKFSFKMLFDKALEEKYNISFDEFSKNLDKNITYMFELTTPYNNIVVQNHSFNITFLAARNIINNIELNIDDLNIGIDKVVNYSLSNVNDIINYVNDRNPSEHEGVVIVDSNFSRIKIKSSAYCYAHKTIDRLDTSDRNCLSIILSEKDDDIFVLMPKDIQNNLLDIKSKYLKFLEEQNNLFMKINKEISSTSDRKEFALIVQKYNPPIKSMFFSLYDKKCNSPKEFIKNNGKNGIWNNSLLDNILESIK